LALRGDPPRENPGWEPGKDNFRYSSELCAFIREHFGEYFTIGVAGFPEGHVLCPDRDQDARYLKKKTDAGADFVITQLFFNNRDYFDYVGRLRKLGVTNRVIPGILPITNYPSLVKFCALCGATVTEEIHKIFNPIQNDHEKTLKAGIDFAVRQCRQLLDGGAPGLHFYCLNKTSPTDQILKAVRR
ncbi:MAG TPA: 5,10-methylenetetrahydrofolate reductase, partial [Candidatus Omnitrophica bacterium]|nr:5,10-methylenetetrahydrofolate reductase [Candidatus Omnitrophota bacterium]